MFRVLNIYEQTCSNGEGWRTAIFLAGCTHNPKCDGCFNETSWDLNSGEEMNVAELKEIIDKNSSIIDGITWVGGEPIQDRYYDGIKEVTEYVQSLGKNVWLYTGFKFGDLQDKWHIFDVIVDGKFVRELASETCKFRGSSNQKIWRRDNAGNYTE